MTQFGQFLSETYGLILLLICGLDVLTVLGSVSTIIVGTADSTIAKVMLGYSITVFGMYFTVYLVPMIQTHDQADQQDFKNNPNLCSVTSLQVRSSGLTSGRVK
jgi:hypothetical protein